MKSNKKILIAGAGAIGSFYGGLMADAGYDVTFLARGKHLEAMKNTGLLRMKSTSHGEKDIPVKAVGKAEGIFDIIIFSAKLHDTESMCVTLKDNLSEDGFVVSFHNGVEGPYLLAKYFGTDRTIAGSLFIASWVDPAGTINQDSTGECVFGAVSEKGKILEPVFKEILDNSRIFNNLSPDIAHTIWLKLVWNVAYNPLSALLLSACGPMIKDPGLSSLMENMVKEVVAAAACEGVTITEEEWRDKIKYRTALETYKTSMLQDIEKNRKPEIDGILKPVIDTLEKHGIKAPYCESIYQALKFKYGRFFLYTPKLAADVIARKGDSILLIERRNEPYGWAIPGGFVDYGEKVEDAAVRELFEETGIKVDKIELLGVYSDPKRDKRGHTVSTVYYAETDMDPVAGDDAKNAVFYPVNALPENLAFDHAEIIAQYVNTVFNKG